MQPPPTEHDEYPVRAKQQQQLAKDGKLEATKRKLQEGYQEFNNGKLFLSVYIYISSQSYSVGMMFSLAIDQRVVLQIALHFSDWSWPGEKAR